jgi:small nuclear ribonucleoprotein (snRNP)-like protein
MLLPIMLVASLFISAAPTVSQNADDLPALPTTLSQERIAMFFTTPQTLASAADDKQANRNKALRLTLTSMMKSHKHRAVQVKLASHHDVVGKLLAVDEQSFTLRTSKKSARIEIRYQDVVGFPKQKLGVGEEIGRDFLIAGIIICALPALPVVPLFLVGISTGLIDD